MIENKIPDASGSQEKEEEEETPFNDTSRPNAEPASEVEKDIQNTDITQKKETRWMSHVDKARSSLRRLEEERMKFTDNQKKNKEKIVSELAQNLENDGMPEFMIGDYVTKMLDGYAVTADYIKRILRKKYKSAEESSVENSENPEIDSNNVSERATIAVASTGQEEVEEDFDKIERRDVIAQSEKIKKLELQISEIETLRKEKDSLSSEVKVLKGKISESRGEIETLRKEKDSLSSEVKVLKEKTQPELFREIKENFYDEPGMLKQDDLMKVYKEAGKNVVLMLKRYTSIIRDAVKSGQPVPVGLYVITKPDMVLVPVRFTIDFDKKDLELSLWEKKVQPPN
jgi:hypothetical protein